jgi:hypothetical protein
MQYGKMCSSLASLLKVEEIEVRSTIGFSSTMYNRQTFLIQQLLKLPCAASSGSYYENLYLRLATKVDETPVYSVI